MLAAVQAGTAGDEGYRDLQSGALASQLDDRRSELADYEQRFSDS